MNINITVLVTGCAGFIGSSVSQALLTRGFNVIGIDNLNNYYSINQKEKNISILKEHSQFKFIKGDIISSQVINDEKPQVVIHLAAMAGVRYSLENPCTYIRNNVEGTVNLLEQCRKNPVQLFLYASSSSVYGNQDKVFVEGMETPLPESPYAMTKIQCELWAKMYHKLYQVPCVGLRFFTVYGPRGRPDMAPFKFLEAISSDKSITMYGNGDTYRDYTFISDIVEGVIGIVNTALGDKNENKLSYPDVYNIGSGTKTYLTDFVSECGKILGTTPKIIQIEKQKGDVDGTLSNIQKINNLCGYTSRVKLTEGLTQTASWLKNKNLNSNSKKINKNGVSVHGLWIGSNLSIVEIMSIKSFLKHGFTYYLYVYDNVKNIPNGCVVRNAETVIPKSEIFTYKNGSYSAFSNYFRYAVLYKHGGIYAD